MKDECGVRGARCGGESGRGSWYMTFNLRAASRFCADALPGWGRGWGWVRLGVGVRLRVEVRAGLTVRRRARVGFRGRLRVRVATRCLSAPPAVACAVG